MSGPVANKIRKLLSESGGMTAGQLLEALGRSKAVDGNLYNTLHKMPDAYIDRWSGPVRGQWVAVWAIMDKPHAPKPSKAAPQADAKPCSLMDAMREKVAKSPGSLRELSRRYGVSTTTIRKWKKKFLTTTNGGLHG